MSGKELGEQVPTQNHVFVIRYVLGVAHVKLTDTLAVYEAIMNDTLQGHNGIMTYASKNVKRQKWQGRVKLYREEVLEKQVNTQ